MSLKRICYGCREEFFYVGDCLTVAVDHANGEDRRHGEVFFCQACTRRLDVVLSESAP